MKKTNLSEENDEICPAARRSNLKSYASHARLFCGNNDVITHCWRAEPTSLLRNVPRYVTYAPLLWCSHDANL